jgi:aryl-alcohol dehydrogenase-like predicted oxidoreductase
LIGASRVEQIEDCAKAGDAEPLSKNEIEKIEKILSDA